MSVSRIEVVGQSEFIPREWIRREVLWASLMAPYSVQMDGWLDDRAAHQHSSNVSRRDLFAQTDTADYQAESFFNQGKNIGGIINSAVLFRACMNVSPEDTDSQPNLVLQTSIIDKVLQGVKNGASEELSDDMRTYQQCKGLVAMAMTRSSSEAEDGLAIKPSAKRPMLHASRLMISLATFETDAWIQNSLQNAEDSLPVLQVKDGGTPRSAGPRVEMLQPIFHEIVASEHYQAL